MICQELATIISESGTLEFKACMIINKNLLKFKEEQKVSLLLNLWMLQI